MLTLRKPATNEIREFAEQLASSERKPQFSELLDIATSDPLLAVWILKKANSSYYGIRSTVDSLRKAFDILGLRGIARMISYATGSEFADAVLAGSSATSRAEKSLQRHSIATANLAAHLSGEDHTEAGPAFTAGLLHDVGKHMIFNNFREESNCIYSESSLWDQIKGADLQTVESLAFGFNHGEAGEFLARKMQFPEKLSIIMRYAFDPFVSEKSPDSNPRLWIVHAASLFASCAGYAAGKRVSFNQCADSPVWQLLIDQGFTSFTSVDAMIDELHSFSRVLAEICTPIRSASGSRLNSDLPPSSQTRSNRYTARNTDADRVDDASSMNQ